MIDKIKTYVENFDEILNGGIPKNSIILVCGTTGCMKSSFVYSILYNNRNERNVIYVSFEQSKESLRSQMHGFGYTGELVIKDRTDIAKGIENIRGKNFMEIFVEYLKLIKKEYNYELIAIDSLPALEVVAELKKPRAELFKFFDSLKNMNVTAFLISEMSQDSNSYGRYDEDFLVDGIIHLKMEEVSDIKVQRRIRCVKLRNSNHSPDWYTLLYSGGVFQAAQVISEA